jgi:hypothetical protein
VLSRANLDALDRLWWWSAFAFFGFSFRFKHAMRSAVFAVILLLSQPIGAILDNVCAPAHSTTVGNNLLYHAYYPTITYFSAMTS